MLHGIFVLCAIAMKRDGIGNRLKLGKQRRFLHHGRLYFPFAAPFGIPAVKRISSLLRYLRKYNEVAMRYILHLAFTAVYQHNRVSLLFPNGIEIQRLAIEVLWMLDKNGGLILIHGLSAAFQGPPHKPMVFFGKRMGRQGIRRAIYGVLQVGVFARTTVGVQVDGIRFAGIIAFGPGGGQRNDLILFEGEVFYLLAVGQNFAVRHFPACKSIVLFGKFIGL